VKALPLLGAIGVLATPTERPSVSRWLYRIGVTSTDFDRRRPRPVGAAAPDRHGNRELIDRGRAG